MSGDQPPAWRGPLLLVVWLATLWQALHLVAGEIALRLPLGTLGDTARLLGDARFWPHLQETLVAFGFPLLIAAASGLLIGSSLGVNRFARDVAEPMLIAVNPIPTVTL
ncbi:MAG: hypothetical protein MUC89_00940 [Acetobacteraceae bacterium]|jgi:NitT/TauT family transport system permease protein|nr:hypothetical protein [Acetobacteraceae bacterium]